MALDPIAIRLLAEIRKAHDRVVARAEARGLRDIPKVKYFLKNFKRRFADCNTRPDKDGAYHIRFNQRAFGLIASDSRRLEETVAHELAHAYMTVHHRGIEALQGPHGPKWSSIARQLGSTGRRCGAPVDTAKDSVVTDGAIGRWGPKAHEALVKRLVRRIEAVKPPVKVTPSEEWCGSPSNRCKTSPACKLHAKE